MDVSDGFGSWTLFCSSPLAKILVIQDLFSLIKIRLNFVVIDVISFAIINFTSTLMSNLVEFIVQPNFDYLRHSKPLKSLKVS